MRSYLGLFVIGTLLGALGCTISEADDTKGDGGGGPSTGNAGGAGTGGRGSGGGGEDDCQGVPVEGECIDGNKIRSCFIYEEPGKLPEIIEVQCADIEKCQIVNGTASCQPTGDCYDGTSRCADASTLEECIDGKWVKSSCGGGDSCIAQPGQPATCAFQEAGSGIHLRGHIEYEFRVPNKDFTDFSKELQQEPAVDLFVTVFDDNELIGMGLTSFGDGTLNPGDWDIELTRKPTGNTFFYFWPMLFDQNGVPFMALAHAESSAADHQQSTKYWFWGFGPVCPDAGECDIVDTGNQLITEEEGSGAAYIYQWLDFGIFRMSGLIPEVAPLSFAVFWEPGNKFDCGNCFAPPQMGGANVLFDPENNLVDHFDTSMNISGTEDSPSHWARTTVNHEFGHWIMQSYSKSPGEGGPHFVDEASKPGLAYSEGWATFAGQSNLSNSPSDNDPIAFRKSGGTSFWVDIGKLVWSGGAIELPDPNGPADQFVNENVITGMMWSLWAENNAGAPQGLGDVPLFRVLTSKRLVGDLNRGYFKVDFFDYLDAMKCEKLATEGQIGDVVQSVGYPYDQQEICP